MLIWRGREERGGREEEGEEQGGERKEGENVSVNTGTCSERVGGDCTQLVAQEGGEESARFLE